MPQVTGTLFEGKPLIQVTVADALPAPPSVSPQTDMFHVEHVGAG
jgi:hypothetical protein